MKCLLKNYQTQGVGIPTILWRGTEGAQIITIAESLGPNLKKLFLLMERKFSIVCISMIAVQMVILIEEFYMS